MKPVLLSYLLVTSACGGGEPEEPPVDATTADAAATIDGPAAPVLGLVDVVVSGYAGFTPAHAVDVPVVFFRPDGSVGTVVRTDAMGHASATIEPGSFVAVVNGNNYIHVESAIASPGDTLRFGPTVLSRVPVGQLNLSWPARVFSGYTTYYYVYTPCGSFETTSTSAMVPLFDGCAGTSFDVVVTSRRSSDDFSAILTRRNVVPTGGTVVVNLVPQTWSFTAISRLQLVHSPVAGEMSRSYCGGVQHLGRMAIHGTQGTFFADTCTLLLMSEPQSTWSAETSFTRNNENRFALQLRTSSAASQLAPMDGSASLPWITNLTFDPITRQLSWSPESPATFDASAVELGVMIGGRYLRWRVYAKNGLPPTFKLPKLPSDLAAYDWIATDAPTISLDNFDFDGVSASEVFTHSLDEIEDAFFDKPRRGSTAHTP